MTLASKADYARRTEGNLTISSFPAIYYSPFTIYYSPSFVTDWVHSLAPVFSRIE